MIAGINYLRNFSVIIRDWETSFTDLQANDLGILGKKSGNILVGNHAVIFTEINSPRFFFSRSVMFVWRMVGGEYVPPKFTGRPADDPNPP